MKVEVIPALWGADDEVFVGGVQEIESPSKDLLRLIAHGEAAGVVRVLEATKEQRATLRAEQPETQEESERNQAAAMETGDWHRGNLPQFILDATERLKNPELDDRTRAYLEVGVADARAIEKRLAKGKLSYDEAVTAHLEAKAAAQAKAQAEAREAEAAEGEEG